eukprot:g56255.t1
MNLLVTLKKICVVWAVEENWRPVVDGDGPAHAGFVDGDGPAHAEYFFFAGARLGIQPTSYLTPTTQSGTDNKATDKMEGSTLELMAYLMLGLALGMCVCSFCCVLTGLKWRRRRREMLQKQSERVLPEHTEGETSLRSEIGPPHSALRDNGVALGRKDLNLLGKQLEHLRQSEKGPGRYSAVVHTPQSRQRDFDSPGQYVASLSVAPPKRRVNTISASTTVTTVVLNQAEVIETLKEQSVSSRCSKIEVGEKWPSFIGAQESPARQDRSIQVSGEQMQPAVVAESGPAANRNSSSSESVNMVIRAIDYSSDTYSNSPDQPRSQSFQSYVDTYMDDPVIKEAIMVLKSISPAGEARNRIPYKRAIMAKKFHPHLPKVAVAYSSPSTEGSGRIPIFFPYTVKSEERTISH